MSSIQSYKILIPINYLLIILWLCSSFNVIHAWDNDELEIFDLVEEINTNFYQFLNVPEDADTKEIKKAFRKLSLVLHPDKNDAPDAEVKFRQLAAVYEILTDEKKRTKYNEVLVNGLPDWKHAVYYYRRVRKMGLLEFFIITFSIFTIGQYIVLWAIYAENKYTAEQLLSSKLKKSQKKLKKQGKPGVEMEDVIFELSKPSVYNLLPFQIVRGTWYTITGLPRLYKFIQEVREERARLKAEQLETSSEEEDESENEEKIKVRKRKKAFVPPELGPEDEINNIITNNDNGEESRKIVVKKQVIVGGLWTDDDLIELARLIKKYPGGSTDRWEKIADSMNRTVAEVTHMARKIKEDLYKPINNTQEEEITNNDDTIEIKPSKIKTKGGKIQIKTDEDNTDTGWSQIQQKALESALTKYPKGTNDRWIKISKCVPNKSVEECVLRFKFLVETIKKKKELENNPEQQQSSEEQTNNTLLEDKSSEVNNELSVE